MSEVTSLIALACFLVLIAIIVFAKWRKVVTLRERERILNQHGWWRWRWSQDGWVRQCKICAAIQYGGDDFDAGPDNSGPIEQ